MLTFVHIAFIAWHLIETLTLSSVFPTSTFSANYKEFSYSRQGRAISGALSYAIEQINNCSCLLPDVELKFLYNDTEGKENKSTEAVVDLICE